MTRLSIVIPVYNAEKTIESLCRTLVSLYGESFRLEIVLVNDCSKDSSHLICRRLQEEFRDVITYIRLARNFGEHNAVMAGLNHATGELCAVMDDDFQNPPEEIARLVGEIGKGYDVVYSYYPMKQDGFFRNLGSRINDRMATIILRKPADLYLSSFKVMNRFVVDEVVKYFGPDPYLDAIILRSTDNIGKVEVQHDKRRHGRSGYTLGKLVSLWGNMVVSYSLIPIRILGIFGIVSTAYGLYTGCHALVANLLPQIPDLSDYQTLNATMNFYRGLGFLAISIIGEYVGRIYLSLNSDPQFVIREVFSRRRVREVRSVQPHTEPHEQKQQTKQD